MSAIMLDTVECLLATRYDGFVVEEGQARDSCNLDHFLLTVHTVNADQTAGLAKYLMFFGTLQVWTYCK